jgi:polar amino acid transport system substrate-binding protein
VAPGRPPGGFDIGQGFHLHRRKPREKEDNMKKLLRIATLLAVALAFAFSGAALAEQKTYINGIDFGFPPFGFVDKDGKPSGFDVESLDWIAKKMGFTVKHQPMDWDGIIPALTAKKIDIIASGMSATAERAKIVNFSIPYYEVTQVLVVKGDNAATFDSLLKSGKKIGVQRGTVTNKLLEELAKKEGYKFELALYDSTDLSMEDVKIGRIDGSGMDSSIAKELMKSQPYKVAGTFDVPSEKYGYAIRKEDKEFLDTINKGLEMLMKDPYWQELKKKYDI